MSQKNVPLPPGCWRILLALPLMFLVEPLDTWLQESFRPLLPAAWGQNLLWLICLGLLIATVVGAWLVILKLADLLFRTRLFPRR